VSHRVSSVLTVLGCVAVVSASPLIRLAAQTTTVEVRPGRATVIAGSRLQMSAVPRDASGKEVTGKTVTWFAAPFDVASVDANGNFTGLRQGRAQVFAIADGKTGIAVVEVEPKDVASVDLQPAQPEIPVGGSTLLNAVARTEDKEPLSNAVFSFRSSDERVATVDQAGVVTGKREGSVILVATTGPARAEAKVNVVPNRVARIAVTGPSQGRTGDVIRLRITAEDSRGLPVNSAPVRWSVSGSGASIEPDGAFVADHPGTYLVTASSGAVAGNYSIKVAKRVQSRKLEQVSHVGFGDLQAGEAWAVNDVAYVSTLADRIYTFDIRDPASPRKVDSLVVDARVVNDVSTTADGRIGVLTREGASSRKNGLVFLDLSEPLHPKVLSEFTETLTGGVHSAFIDGHYVYATDDATGALRIISFENPRAPKEVSTWAVPESNLGGRESLGSERAAGRTLHDVQVKDGLAYLAYWRHGLIILDVGNGMKGGSPEKPAFVSQLVYNVADYYPPDMIAGTHAVFRYKNYVFLGDEVFPAVFNLASRARIHALGRVHIVDVSDIEHPRKVAEYNVQDMGSHNMWVEDDVMYIGYYEGGLRAVDVSGELRGDLMAQGREIGAVWTGSPDGYRPNLPMAWGAQPHKGMVYVSDINSGLWVAKLTEAPRP
jgi:hypothetical protein